MASTQRNPTRCGLSVSVVIPMYNAEADLMALLNCLAALQYNYSHGNDGAGYLLYQFSGANPFGGNVVRYNISENDGRRGSYSGIYAGGDVGNTEIYNNTIYTSPSASGGQQQYASHREPATCAFAITFS
jgi:hypothetical protein